MITQGYGGARMAAPNKKVARSNKSRAVVLATNKARRQRGACSWRETQLRGHALPPLSLMGLCMFFDERTNRLRQELAAMSLTFESNERADRLIQELAAEKEDQIEVVMMIISPLILAAAIAVFIVCFWPYDAGLLISVGAAVLTLPVLTEGASFLIGKVGGKRATRRF